MVQNGGILVAMVHDALRRRLRERREGVGMNQAEAAAAADISQQYISGLERGANEPPIVEHLARLARAYGTSTDYLLGVTDDPRPPNDVSPPRHGVEIWDILRGLPAARGDELLRIARDMLRLEIDANERAVRVLVFAAGAVNDENAKPILAEALRLSAIGDAGGVVGLVEGYLSRRGGANVPPRHDAHGSG